MFANRIKNPQLRDAFLAEFNDKGGKWTQISLAEATVVFERILANFQAKTNSEKISDKPDSITANPTPPFHPNLALLEPRA